MALGPGLLALSLVPSHVAPWCAGVTNSPRQNLLRLAMVKTIASVLGALLLADASPAPPEPSGRAGRPRLSWRSHVEKGTQKDRGHLKEN